MIIIEKLQPENVQCEIRAFPNTPMVTVRKSERKGVALQARNERAEFRGNVRGKSVEE